MAQQNFQGNRPQTQANRPTQQTSATATEERLTPREENRIAAALELGKQQEEQENGVKSHEVTLEDSDNRSIPAKFKGLLIVGIDDLLHEDATPGEVKRKIRAYIEHLSVEDRNANRFEMQEIARHVMSSVEDIIQEMPALLL